MIGRFGRFGNFEWLPAVLAAVALVVFALAFAYELLSYQATVVAWAKGDLESRARLAADGLAEPLRTQNEDIVRGLSCGADDYVTKPFDRLVLLARVRAVLRRGLPVTEGVDFDGLKIDEANRTATLRGKAVELTAGEFKLLVKLVAHRGRVFARPADERTVDVQVANIRKKLGRWGDHIETIRGVGYRVKV